MNAYILIGLPGSGKSTWAQNNASCSIINRDSIRKMLYGGRYAYVKEDEPMILNMALDLAKRLCIDLKDIIIDETGVNINTRAKFIKIFKDWNYRVVYVWFKTPIDLCKERRKKDSKGLDQDWSAVIDNMNTSMRSPSKEEGYDELIEIQ